jgi:hypothetical protein
VVFEVRLVTAGEELAVSNLDSSVSVKIPVDTTSLEDGQALQVSTYGTWGAHSGTVVGALRYKPEGCRFASRLCHWIFFIDIILLVTLWPWG